MRAYLRNQMFRLLQIFDACCSWPWLGVLPTTMQWFVDDVISVYKRPSQGDANTQGEVTSQSLWSRYDRHFVGVTRHNALS